MREENAVMAMIVNTGMFLFVEVGRQVLALQERSVLGTGQRIETAMVDWWVSRSSAPLSMKIPTPPSANLVKR